MLRAAAPLLALKLVLAPALIVAVSVAGQRFGARIAGGLVALPVVAGPIAFFIALEQGAAFGAEAARATLASQLSLAAFSITYGWSCLRAPWFVCLPLGWLAFAVSTLLLQRSALPFAAAVLAALAVPFLMQLLPRLPRAAPAGGMPAAEVVARMVAGAALVLAITSAARGLGPRLSGLLTLFPIAVSVVTVFSHRSQGPAFTVNLLRGLGLGLVGLTAFFVVVAVGLPRLGVAAAFALACIAAIITQVAVIHALRGDRA